MNYFSGNYASLEDFKKHVLYRKIVKMSADKLVLDDGSVITIEMTESDCCAWAGGKFTNVALDAAITDVTVSDVIESYNWGETTNAVTVTVLHNQNIIAQAECKANDGNGGYYYSVCALKVKDIYLKVVSA